MIKYEEKDMKTIGKLLQEKGSQVWSVSSDTTVQEALSLMDDKDTGAVLVIDGTVLVGILSERDCARKVTLPGRSADGVLVAEIMTPRVLCVRTAQGIEECMALMTKNHIRHLPVLDDNNRVIGVISIGDVGNAIIAQQEFRIAHLEQYISGAEAALYRSS
jgi:CBS domain-containing protein